MSTITPERLASLPQWARFLIAKLRADVADAEKRARIIEAPWSSPTLLGPYRDHPIHLPDEAIAFLLGENGTIHVQAVAGQGGRRVRMYSTDGRLLIQPCAADAIEVIASEPVKAWKQFEAATRPSTLTHANREA